MPAAFNLQRFVEAQEGVFETALAELGAGRKRSHWIWFVFPQLVGLGRSPTALYFGIQSLEEARAYLAHDLLGPRYRESVKAILGWAGRRNVVAILGETDATKLRSSLTLFERASPDPQFEKALEAFFGGPDPITLELLEKGQG
jgi:uncharacterized protein (DUF1810 family)